VTDFVEIKSGITPSCALLVLWRIDLGKRFPPRSSDVCFCGLAEAVSQRTGAPSVAKSPRGVLPQQKNFGASKLSYVEKNTAEVFCAVHHPLPF
jgi:hypothetical protein